MLSHYDADGLAAAGVMGSALNRLDAKMRIRIIKGIDPETLDDAFSDPPDLAVFCDIGSGYLDQIAEKAAGTSVIVLDHHQSQGKPSEKLLHVNPHEYGFEGSKEISGAGVTYLTARGMEPGNKDLAALAVVGALGDMQDKGEKRSLYGLNGKIVEDAVEAKQLNAQLDLIFYGRETRPAFKALAYTTNPFLPGISGDEEAAVQLFTQASIPIKIEDRWRTISDLAEDEKRRLLDKVIETLSSKGFRAAVALDLIGTVYTLLAEDRGTALRDAREYSSLLNACGRMDRPSVAVALNLGDRDAALQEASQILAEYRKQLSGYMKMITEKPERVQTLRAIQVVRGEEWLAENMTSAVSSLLPSTGLFDPGKALIVSARTTSGRFKISARASEILLGLGANLGLALKAAAEKHNGQGGGHDVAAGADVPLESGEAFLAELDEVISKQISGKP